MSAWRYSEPQSKRAGAPTYMPREHRPERAFWRGIGALLPQRAEVGRSMPPATIDALGRRREDDLLAEDIRIRVRAIGVVYGSNNSVVGDIIDDQLSVSTALLREKNAVLAAEAENAVSLADDGVLALKRLAQNLARAAGGDGAAPWTRAEETAYAALDGHYRTWLAGLDDTTDAVEAITAWKTTAYRVIRGLGADLIRDSGPAAWAGREVSTLKGPEFITTPRAEAWFLRALHTTFGAPAPKQKEEVTV
jgi:CRISPR system Cascade subunit CasA